MTRDRRRAALLGGAIVLSSGAVLVMEILAVRLLGPYVGTSLETTTVVIGTILAGISAGVYVGGQLADEHDPWRLMGAEFLLGGLFALLVVPIVRALAPHVGGSSALAVVLSTFAFFLPAAVLSAVTPAAAKTELRDLSRSGGTIGRISALSTAGALAGTFGTGFLLVGAAPVSLLFTLLGVLLCAFGIVLGVNRTHAAAALPAIVIALATPNPCDEDTEYHCIRATQDRSGGITLWLDDLRHSYVRVEDPAHLEFPYVQAIAASLPEGRLDVLHVGGGGFTLPRWLRATRPGSSSKVLEVDGELVDFDRRRLGLRTGDDISVAIGDARHLIADEDRRAYDAVIVDAFARRAAPWQLTTIEWLRAARARLVPGGLYAANLLDGGDLPFVRAQARTALEVFDHVDVLAVSDDFRRGNFVLLASDRPLDRGRVLRGGRRWRFVPDIREFAAGSRVLEDDFAPVDQLLDG